MQVVGKGTLFEQQAEKLQSWSESMACGFPTPTEMDGSRPILQPFGFK
jgi:hypothetical protein